METIEKRALVVDDNQRTIREFAEFGGIQFDCALIDIFSSEDPFGDLENSLKNNPYAVIIMDGDLSLNLDEYNHDGIVLSERLRRGIYGETNQNTPILNSSSSYPNDYADEWVSKDDRRIEETVNLVKDKYLK